MKDFCCNLKLFKNVLKGYFKKINGMFLCCCGMDMVNYNVENCCIGKRFNKRNKICCKYDYFDVYV